MAAPELLEVIMLICFGMSWPTAVIKSIRTKSTRGKSLLFLCFIFVGYICGILSKVRGEKFLSGEIPYALYFYCVNLIMVGTDLVVYFINRSHERQSAEGVVPQ